ncbi:hypothetical protein FOL47_008313 [Perkinsus chesapeaki]|uniref:Uncharacterized protein n=1 Tax=Perkinsus chesapeaki TaxID=330153 RepID=A0A7J6LFP0_PERCH|nr:hypothetical protein FOL47_008313 [Perkinsus chesapeaki]
MELQASTGPVSKYFKHIGGNVCVQVDWLNRAANAAQPLNILVICGQDKDNITLTIKKSSPTHYEITTASYPTYVDFVGFIENCVCLGIIRVDPGDLRDYEYFSQRATDLATLGYAATRGYD